MTGLALIMVAAFLVFPFPVGMSAVPLMLLDARRFFLYATLFTGGVAYYLWHLVPRPDMDLARYWSYIAELERAPFKHGLRTVAMGEDPLSYTSMFLAGSWLGVQSIAPLAAIVGYAIYFWLLRDFWKKTEAGRAAFAIAVGFFVATHHVINVFTGYRFGLGVAVFLLGTYLILVRGSWGGLPLIVCAPFFHGSLVAMVAVVAAVYLLRSVPWLVQVALSALLGASTSFLLYFSESVARIPAFEFVARRAEYYLSGYDALGWWGVVQIASGLLGVALTWLVLRDEAHDRFALFFRTFFLISLVGIVNIGNFHVASRMFTISRVGIALAVVAVLSSAAAGAKMRILVVLMCALLAVGVFLNQVAALQYVDQFQSIRRATDSSLFR